MKRSKYSRSTRSALVRLAASARRRMRDAERARIAAQFGQPRQQVGVRRTRKQGCEQRIFLRPRGIHFVDVTRHVVAVEVGP